ncbi:hypothetical protein [Pantoea sp.]|uniref:hypothetical protein n=1 Tax=Pantoea sp. TaxID=69393 RepID=UPI0031D90B42
MSENEYAYLIEPFFSTLSDDYEKLGKLNNFRMKGPISIVENEKELLEKLADFSDEFTYPENTSEHEKTLFHAKFFFSLLGHQVMALRLAEVTARMKILLSDFPQVVENELDKRAKSRRSVKASEPRHPLHDVVVKIIIATWGKYPHASQGQMIVKIKKKFGPHKISDISIKRWIKNENLRPIEYRTDRSLTFNLVIPSDIEDQGS